MENNKPNETQPKADAKKHTMSMTYKGTDVQKLVTEETAKMVLSRHFENEEWPISGGWGYTQETAVVVEAPNGSAGVDLEYKFMKFRTYEEAIIRPEVGQRLKGIRFSDQRQSLVQGKDGKFYDCVKIKVTAFKEADFDYLKNDWDSHNKYADDETGLKEHIRFAESKMISYEIVGWFDITSFFGMM